MADDSVERLRRARKTASVAYMEAVALEARFPTALKAVVEGRDLSYYIGRITSLAPELEVHGLCCEGKQNVLYVYEKLLSHEEYAESLFCFFIDRDYDNNLDVDPNRVYVTPCHSLENLYVSEATTLRLLSSEFSLSPVGDTQDDFENLRDMFKHQVETFEQEMRYVAIWIIAQARRSAQDGSPLPNFGNVQLSDLAEITVESVAKCYVDSQLINTFQNASRITHGEFLSAESEIDAGSVLLEFRGKYVAEFFRTWLILLKRDRTSRNPTYFSARGRVNLSFGKQAFLSELSQYADTPPCLIEFMTNLANRASGLPA